MNNTLSKIIIFAAGALVGSAVTWTVVKSVYEQRAQEEIDSVIAKFEEMTEQQSEEKPDKEVKEEPVTSERLEKLLEYKKMLDDEGYSEDEEKEIDAKMKRPYVISPDDFGEYDYATVSLIYYADGVVTNERGKIIANVDELIGEESLTHFGEYEEDSVFVRNEEMEIDYEILKDYRNFSEID